jgi:TPP-dependent 2-oxoacid decarboxylase
MFSKELLEVGLTRKVKCTELVNKEGKVINLNKGSYFVNPMIIMPPDPYYDLVLWQWNFLSR